MSHSYMYCYIAYEAIKCRNGSNKRLRAFITVTMVCRASTTARNVQFNKENPVDTHS
jgi:hypothetical protein